ncbi:unnamed protein product [Xyrichtys novacula]|uniref:Unnamed protein product n=1 Tax=Xyrichtys novacula TaxID=13765 RepID=A0AAV1GK18_XYRNO|nr:unnamed protein product [Xyrichtys novacula]
MPAPPAYIVDGSFGAQQEGWTDGLTDNMFRRVCLETCGRPARERKNFGREGNKHDIITAAIITQLFCTIIIIYLPRLPEMSEQSLARVKKVLARETRAKGPEGKPPAEERRASGPEKMKEGGFENFLQSPTEKLPYRKPGREMNMK